MADALRTLLDSDLEALRRAAMIVTGSPELGDEVLRDALVTVASRPRLSPNAALRLVLTALHGWHEGEGLVDNDPGGSDVRAVLLAAMTELDAADRFALATAEAWPGEFTHLTHTDATSASDQAKGRLTEVLQARGHKVVGGADASDTELFRRPG